MPAILDDPDTPTIYRTSGDPPFPDPNNPQLPPDVQMHQVTLRDRQTVATIVPFPSYHNVPRALLEYLTDQFNKEIEGGDTYPMMEPMSVEKFASYWFQNFGSIVLLGGITDVGMLNPERDWPQACLGSFYIKPNYPGRSSHVCNAGFLVTDASRNRGVGRLMGEAYLEWAPKLGYTYSVFNLVYETNVASCRIWDSLGFKRIGRVKGCGDLKSHPGRLVDAIIFGRDLVGPEAEELQSEDRFDKIKFYLKYGKYPQGADRAEKSRLRSAATHYKLLEGDKLMHKDKEVISDPQKQYEIARQVHEENHAGINKTTAAITEKYHWRSIKDTASEVIKQCEECARSGRTMHSNANAMTSRHRRGNVRSTSPILSSDKAGAPQVSPSSLDTSASPADSDPLVSGHNESLLADHFSDAASLTVLSESLKDPTIPSSSSLTNHHTLSHDGMGPHGPIPQSMSPAVLSHSTLHDHTSLDNPGTSLLSHHEPQHHHHNHTVYQPIGPQILVDSTDHHHHHHHSPFALSSHHHTDTDFHSLLNVEPQPDGQEDSAAVDRDLSMFVQEPPNDDDVDVDVGVGVVGIGSSIQTQDHTMTDADEDADAEAEVDDDAAIHTPQITHDNDITPFKREGISADGVGDLFDFNTTPG